MSNIKRAAAEAVAEWLGGLPGLAGVPIVVGPADYEQDRAFPSVVVVPQRLTLEPFQQDEYDASAPNTLLLHVGEFTGQLELRVCAASAPEREQYEDAILEAILVASDVGPGSLRLRTGQLEVGGQRWLQPALVGLWLTDEEWREEAVFSSERYSWLTLDCAMPALVAVNAPPIKQLVLAMNEDLNSDVPAESRQVNEDGTLTAL